MNFNGSSLLQQFTIDHFTVVVKFTSCEVPSPGEVGGHVILLPSSSSHQIIVLAEQKYVVGAPVPFHRECHLWSLSTLCLQDILALTVTTDSAI